VPERRGVRPVGETFCEASFTMRATAGPAICAEEATGEAELCSTTKVATGRGNHQHQRNNGDGVAGGRFA